MSISTANAAPLYISVGPQCAGKTTYLSTFSTEVVDISIDDQDGVYFPLPFEFFLNPFEKKSFNRGESQQTRPSAADDEEDLKSKIVYDKTLLERITCPTQMEMKVILKYFSHETRHKLNNIISDDIESQSFSLEKELKGIAKNHASPSAGVPAWKLEYSEDLLQDLIQAAVSLRNQNTSLNQRMHFCSPNNKIDLFIPEAIFNPPDLALEKAKSLLGPPPHKPHPSLQNRDYSNVPIAWGNTNTRPFEYVAALESAQKSGRPVYFIVFDAIGPGSSTNDNEKSNEKDDYSLDKVPPLKINWELPYLSRKELIQRNIKRFLTTGKYINVNAIDQALTRCQDLIRAAKKEMSASKTLAVSPTDQKIDKDILKRRKFDFDRALAKLAGFEMGSDRKVVQVGEPQNIYHNEKRKFAQFPDRDVKARGRGRGRGRGQDRLDLQYKRRAGR